jgi:hypothetical protein
MLLTVSFEDWGHVSEVNEVQVRGNIRWFFPNLEPLPPLERHRLLSSDSCSGRLLKCHW